MSLRRQRHSTSEPSSGLAGVNVNHGEALDRPLRCATVTSGVPGASVSTVKRRDSGTNSEVSSCVSGVAPAVERTESTYAPSASVPTLTARVLAARRPVRRRRRHTGRAHDALERAVALHRELRRVVGGEGRVERLAVRARGTARDVRRRRADLVQAARADRLVGERQRDVVGDQDLPVRTDGEAADHVEPTGRALVDQALLGAAVSVAPTENRNTLSPFGEHRDAGLGIARGVRGADVEDVARLVVGHRADRAREALQRDRRRGGRLALLRDQPRDAGRLADVDHRLLRAVHRALADGQRLEVLVGRPPGRRRRPAGSRRRRRGRAPPGCPACGRRTGRAGDRRSGRPGPGRGRPRSDAPCRRRRRAGPRSCRADRSASSPGSTGRATARPTAGRRPARSRPRHRSPGCGASGRGGPAGRPRPRPHAPRAAGRPGTCSGRPRPGSAGARCGRRRRRSASTRGTGRRCGRRPRCCRPGPQGAGRDVQAVGQAHDRVRRGQRAVRRGRDVGPGRGRADGEVTADRRPATSSSNVSGLPAASRPRMNDRCTRPRRGPPAGGPPRRARTRPRWRAR